MNAEALAALFLSVQMTFPAIPPGAQEHGIMGHPDIHSKDHHYDMWCCSLKDCRPLADGALKRTEQGYVVPLPDGQRAIVPYTSNKIRRTPPSAVGTEFGQSDHACYNKVDGKWAVRCLYPRGGLF
jgi:hypothetical protein